MFSVISVLGRTNCYYGSRHYESIRVDHTCQFCRSWLINRGVPIFTSSNFTVNFTPSNCNFLRLPILSISFSLFFPSFIYRASKARAAADYDPRRSRLRFCVEEMGIVSRDDVNLFISC